MEHAVELPASLNPPPAKPVLLEYYTDPLCPRSWAFEAHWQRLRAEFGHRFAWRYRLGGPLPHPPASTPTNEGKWLAQTSGAPMATQLHTGSVPATGAGPCAPASYRAGLAVKCAERQGAQAGELYLRAMRAAVRQAHGEVCCRMLTAVADALAAQVPALFNAAAFRQDMAANAGAAAFAEDLQQASYHHIHCLPTIVMRRGTAPDLVVAAPPLYEVLLQNLAHLAPDLFYVPSLVDGGAG